MKRSFWLALSIAPILGALAGCARSDSLMPVVSARDASQAAGRDGGPASVNLNGVAWSGSQFIAVGGMSGAGVIVTSPDGTTWTSPNTEPDAMRL